MISDGSESQLMATTNRGEVVMSKKTVTQRNQGDPKKRQRSGRKLPSTAAGKSSDALRRATGRDYNEWFARLDAWGAPGRPYREIADWLTGKHDVSRWWAQKLIVEYEQERGLRPPGIRRDGTFEVGASKTVAVPVGRLFDAFVNSRQRRKWLIDRSMSLRTSRPGREARFDWEDGVTRVVVGFTAKGKTKSQVAVRHEHLPNAQTAEETKAYWRERMVALKAMLE
jgi:hypothetical protein